ncbi:MAG: hypothetical protein JXB88_01820 [Spirochaetales bacterium]|nr:hypothetical protein [Spirochaetales bacterium]
MHKEEPEIITFHFKMDMLMMDELAELEIFQKTQNLSGTINRILLQLFTIIEKEDVEEKQRFSKYRLVNEDRTIPRINVIIKIPDFLYRRLKSLHDVLNYYSMAQLMRDLLQWFLDLVDEFGKGYKEKLMELVNKWCEFSRNSCFLIKYIDQLLKFEGEIMEIIKMFYIYSLHFSPYRVFRL